MPSLANLAKRHMAAQDCRLVGRLERRSRAQRFAHPAAAHAGEGLYAGRLRQYGTRDAGPQLGWARLG